MKTTTVCAALILAAAVGTAIPVGIAAMTPVRDIDPWGGASFVMIFDDDTYLICDDPDEAAKILAEFPYLADMLVFSGDLHDPDVAVYFGYQMLRGLRPRLLTGIISGGSEG